MDLSPTSLSHASSPVDPSTPDAPRLALVCNASYSELQAGALSYAREHGLILDATALRCPGRLPAVDGISGILANTPVDSYRDWVAERNCPVVHLMDSPPPPGSPRVVCDMEAVGRMGARHLMELGNLSIAFYCFWDDPDDRECRDGFVSEVEAHGRTAHLIGPCLVYEEDAQFTVSRARRVDWLKSHLPLLAFPLAVMTDDDVLAVDLAQAAHAMKLRIPEDMAILGVYDQPLTLGVVKDPISSVDVNFHEVGRRSCELLHRMLQGAKPGSDEVPMFTKIPPRGVVVRNSTVTFQCDHPGVTAAAMFVRQHFHEAISVRDVAAHAKMSVRSLQVNYPQRVGRTVKDDILCERLKRARTILENSDLKLAAVAMESGLGTLENLCRVFQATHRMTPHAWRMEHRRI